MQQSLIALLHRANQVAMESFDAAQTETTLTARQIQVLAAIGANEGASQTEIVAITGIDRSTLAEIARRLQVKRFIHRRRSKTDARANTLTLSEVGKQELAQSKPVLSAVEKDFLNFLSPAEHALLLNLLTKFVDSYEVRGRA